MLISCVHFLASASLYASSTDDWFLEDIVVVDDWDADDNSNDDAV
jgi:hypothetical protein